MFKQGKIPEHLPTRLSYIFLLLLNKHQNISITLFALVLCFFCIKQALKGYLVNRSIGMYFIFLLGLTWAIISSHFLVPKRVEQTLLVSGYTPNSYNAATCCQPQRMPLSSYSHLLLIHCRTQAFPSKAPVGNSSHYYRDCLFISPFGDYVSRPCLLVQRSSCLSYPLRCLPPSVFVFCLNSLVHRLKARDL